MDHSGQWTYSKTKVERVDKMSRRLAGPRPIAVDGDLRGVEQPLAIGNFIWPL